VEERKWRRESGGEKVEVREWRRESGSERVEVREWRRKSGGERVEESGINKTNCGLLAPLWPPRLLEASSPPYGLLAPS